MFRAVGEKQDSINLLSSSPTPSRCGYKQMVEENSKIEPCNNLGAMYRDVVVLGCGNILFGDDGFGPCVAEYLQNCIRLPENVSVINAGTSVRGILFDLVIGEQRPRKIIVIDAIDAKRRSGEIFRIEIDELPKNKTDDFTLHEMPASNLLRELNDLCDVEVIIIAGQIDHIPEEVSPGLSPALAQGVAVAAEEVLKLCDEQTGG